MKALILLPLPPLPVALQVTAVVVLLFAMALALSAIGGRFLGWLFGPRSAEKFFEEEAPTHYRLEYDRKRGITVAHPVFRAPPLQDPPPANQEEPRP